MKELNITKPRVIAEIGCNHKGDFLIAVELVKKAKECGADVAKFQKRTPNELLTPEQYNAPHPNVSHAYGSTYGEHREFLEFNVDQHRKLLELCGQIGIEYSTSVWDTTSAKDIVALQPKLIKVPSACNNNFKMLEILRDEYNGDVHVSFGMTTHEEEEELVRFFEKGNQAQSRLIVYSCTSGYPVSFDDICLLEIVRLKDHFSRRVKEIGFSGHHLGIAVDIAAYTLGASWIERHFTLDRTWKGTDHAASLEPEGLRKLIRNLGATYQALRSKPKEILDVEEVQRRKLKFQK